MKKLIYFSYLCVLVFMISFAEAQEKNAKSDTPMNYPKTKKVDQVDEYFGTKVPDPYRWLEQSDSGAVKNWVEDQNEVTFAYLEQITAREHIKKRLTKLWNYEKYSAPFKEGDYYYFYKNDGLQNQYVLYRQKSLDAKAEVFLDPNKFSEDGTISLAGTSFSQDGKLFAYSISRGGSDWREIYVMDVATKELLPDVVKDVKFTGISWRGKQGFYYSKYDKPEDGKELTAKTQYHKLFFHKLGSKQSEDKLVFGGEKTPRRYIGSYLTEDERFLVITAATSTSGNELYIQDLDQPGSQIVQIVGNFDNDHYVVANEGSRLLIETNYQAPNNRLVETTIANPKPETWKDVIPETENVLSSGTAGGKIFAEYMIDAKNVVKQYDMKGKFEKEVSLPGLGSVGGFSGKQDATELFYSFTSFTYPTSIFRYDIATGKSTLFKKPDIDINPEDYETKQVFYKSKDGTKVPMFIVYKKGIELNGLNPTYLYSYGGFNVSLTPGFSISRMILLENGGIYAQPNIRGGGEYGEKWHKAGTKMQKQNVFDDFIAAAEYLIENKYTSSEYLGIAGGSNGGLLVGATMTQRPDLMKVAFPAVGVMDMLRYHKFTAGAGWASDYGTADDSKEMFEYLHNYSPVHALKEGVSYPSTMVTTSDHDDRVVPGHSFKFAATLQEKHAGKNPVLIRIENKAGHGAGTPTSKIIERSADTWGFFFHEMGVNIVE